MATRTALTFTVTARRITLRVGWARNAVRPPDSGIGGFDGS